MSYNTKDKLLYSLICHEPVNPIVSETRELLIPYLQKTFPLQSFLNFKSKFLNFIFIICFLN